MKATYQRSWLWFVVAILMVPTAYGQGQTILVANFMNGNNVAFNSRVYLFNPSQSTGSVTVRVFTLPVSSGLAQELTGTPLSLGTLEGRSALNVKLAEDILAPLGITLPYPDNGGDLTLEFTIQAPDVRGATQVFSSSLAFGTNPLQEIPSSPSGSPTVLVANFMNGNDAALNSHVYLFNPSTSTGNVAVRVFTLPLAGGTVQELTGTPLDLGILEARSALNVRVAEDILIPLGITTPYTTDGGNLTLEFTIEASDVRGAAQVFSSGVAFGVYPLQVIPSTSGASPTVLVANFTNGNNDVFNSRIYLWNPSTSAGLVSYRLFTLPLGSSIARELRNFEPKFLGTLEAKSALNIKLAEDILIPLRIPTPYIADGGNLTLEFTIEAPDVRGVAQVFSSNFAFGTYPLQEVPSTSAGSPTVLVANFMNGNNDALNSRVYLWNPSQSAGTMTVRAFTLPLRGGTAQELTGSPLSLGNLRRKSARNIKLAEDILTPLGIATPYTIDGGNLALEFTILAADVRGAAQVFSSDFAFGTYPLQEIPPFSIATTNVTGSAEIVFPSDGATFSPFSGGSRAPLPIIGSVLAEFEAMEEGNIYALATLSIPTTTFASCPQDLSPGTTRVQAAYQVSQIAGTVSGQATVLDDLARVPIIPGCPTDFERTAFRVPPGAQSWIDLMPLANRSGPPGLPPNFIGDGTADFAFTDTFNGLSDRLAFPPVFPQGAPLTFGRWQIFPPGTYTVSLTLTVGGTSVDTASSTFTVTEGP